MPLESEDHFNGAYVVLSFRCMDAGESKVADYTIDDLDVWSLR